MRLTAQDTTARSIRWLTANGSLTALGELYNRDGVGVAARPDQTGRIVANLTLGMANGLVTVPLTALISTDQVTFRQQINQLGVSPRYRAVTLHLGHVAPSWSSFTLADQTLLGGGVEMAPGMLRAGVVAGRARKAIAPDTLNLNVLPGDPGLARWAYGARLGIGNAQGSFVDLIALQVKDDRGSLDSSLVVALPDGAQENSVVGLTGRLAVGGRLTVDVQAASSRYAREQAATGVDDATGEAAAMKLGYRLGDWTVGGTVEYLSTGFRTLGNAGLVGDRLDYGLTLGGRLAQGKVVFNLLGGWRQNNLDDELEATTEQALYSVNATLQPAPAFGLDLQATNNVNDHRAVIDSVSVKNVTAQYAVTPRFLWRTGSAQHVLVLLGTFQQSENTSPGSLAPLDVSTRTYVGTWSMTLPSSFAVTATVTRTEVEPDTFPRTTVSTIAPGVSYALLRGQLQLSLQSQFTRAETQGGAPSEEVFPLVQVRYAFAHGQSLQLRTSVRHHELAAGGGTFDERILTLQYSATWR
jgi:hypothetical protein